jgi:hypothetical protein
MACVLTLLCAVAAVCCRCCVLCAVTAVCCHCCVLCAVTAVCCVLSLLCAVTAVCCVLHADGVSCCAHGLRPDAAPPLPAPRRWDQQHDEVLLQGAAKHGYYPPAPRQQVQELLKDPSLGFCQRVRHQPSAPLPDDDPQEGQQGEGKAQEKAAGQEGKQVEGQEGKQAQPAAAGDEGKVEQGSPAGKPSSDVDTEAAAAAKAEAPAPAAKALTDAEAPAPAPADAPTPAAGGTAGAQAAAEGACATPVLALPPGASCKVMGDKEWHTFVGNMAKRVKALRRALADPNYVEPPRPGSGGAEQGCCTVCIGCITVSSALLVSLLM